MNELYKRNPKIEESPLQNDLMLFDPVSSSFFILNRTMAYLWRNCDGETTVEKVVEAMRNHFSDADNFGSVIADMKSAVSELIALGLITEKKN